jgi:hypothetical protein
LNIRFNEIALYWVMSISDTNGNLLLDCLPMTTGRYPAGNILQQHGSLGIGSAYMVDISGSGIDYPDATNLGTAFLLLWDDTAP